MERLEVWADTKTDNVVWVHCNMTLTPVVKSDLKVGLRRLYNYVVEGKFNRGGDYAHQRIDYLICYLNEDGTLERPEGTAYRTKGYKL